LYRYNITKKIRKAEEKRSRREEEERKWITIRG
jgi:hypothetical protein